MRLKDAWFFKARKVEKAKRETGLIQNFRRRKCFEIYELLRH